MTKEEARKHLIDISYLLGDTSIQYASKRDGKIMRDAISELEQEPKQVELEGDSYSDGEIVYDYGKCPKCGWEFEEGDKDWEEPYCCHCGQKLHWFEVNRNE